jgi:hypothetical protein
MWPSRDEQQTGLPEYPRGGVAPTRRDNELHKQMKRQAERAKAERRVRFDLIPLTIRAIGMLFAAGERRPASRRFFFKPVCAVALGLALGAGLATAPAAAGGMKRLDLIEHAGGEAVVDLGAEGDSAGDILTFRNEVFDETDANKAGSIHGWCIRVVAGESWECFWTLMHEDGQIAVEGPFLDAGESKLAVTGGTGAFAGVRGEMLLRARNAEGSKYDLQYTLIY